MTAPQPQSVVAVRVGAGLGVFFGWIMAGAGFRIGWDVIGWILDALAARVG